MLNPDHKKQLFSCNMLDFKRGTMFILSSAEKNGTLLVCKSHLNFSLNKRIILGAMQTI